LAEADVKGFFDHQDRDKLLAMLSLRIDDRAFLGLLRKWLKAGILEPDGHIVHPDTGTPQGGIVSPVSANAYLQYVLDLWFEQVVYRGGRLWRSHGLDSFNAHHRCSMGTAGCRPVASD